MYYPFGDLMDVPLTRHYHKKLLLDVESLLNLGSDVCERRGVEVC